MEKPYDVAIIGSGIIGATIAYKLIKTHPCKLAIFDQSLIGHGATFYSAGLSAPLATTTFMKKLLQNNECFFEADFPDLIHKKKIYYILKEENLSAFNKIFENNDLKIEPFSAINKLKKYFPDIQISNSQKILSSQICHYASPYLLTEKMICKLRNHDLINIYESTKVINLTKNQKNNLIEIETSYKKFFAKKVFVCTGPWMKDNFFDKHNHLKTKRIVAFHSNKKMLIGPNAPVIMFYDDGAFLLPYEGKHWLLSVTSQKWNVNPSHNSQLTEDDYSLARLVMDKYIPKSIFHFQGGRAFCDAYTDNKDPYIRAEEPSIIICSGFSGSGYRLAEAAATEALKYVIDLRK